MLKYKIGKKDLKTGKITYGSPKYTLSEAQEAVIKMNQRQPCAQPKFWYTYEPVEVKEKK